MKVNLYANFRQLAGAKSVDIDLPNGSSLPQLLDCLLTLHPTLGPVLVDNSHKLLSHVHVFINGRDTQYLPEGTSLLLTPSDKIDIFPPVGGGCDLSETNEEDCLGNKFPVYGGCLWAQGIIQCP